MLTMISELNKNSEMDLYVQVYRYFKNHIESGQINANEKIPSIRQLALDLDLSRTTVENAYNQLLLEGYIYSKSRSGYYASDIGNAFPSGTFIKSDLTDEPGLENFNYEYINEDNFNFNIWKKYYNEVLTYENLKLLKEGLPQGEYELRKEIAEYVYRARGVHGNPARMIIGAGVQVLLGILSVLLREMNIESIAVEEPGFTDVRHIFKDYYLNIEPVPLTGQGLDIDALEKCGTRVCYVSPTHQYPTGAIMPVSKRIDLLKWANKVDGYIIEDDYDSELRYSGKPVPSLQGLDSDDRVIYLGSFSTLLIPSIRISYLILPERFYTVYMRNRHKYRQTVSKTEQLVLALYIKEGEFEKHLRRIRKKYSARHNLFKQLIESRSLPKLKPESSGSGVYIPLRFDSSVNVPETVKRLNTAGFRVRHISGRLAVFNFACLPDNKLSEAVDKLESILSNI